MEAKKVSVIENEIKELEHGVKVDIINPIDLADIEKIITEYKTYKEEKMTGNHSPFFYSEGDDFKRIGSGSFGVVYGYKDYAIKWLKSSKDDDGSEYIASCSNDISVLKKISHLSYIPTLYAVIEDRIIISERIYGTTVENYAYSHRYHDNQFGVTQQKINDFSNNICELVSMKWQPSDLHAENVMICERTGDLKIVDVGMFGETFREYEDYEDIRKKNYCYDNSRDWVMRPLEKYLRKFEERKEKEQKEEIQDQSYII